MKDVVIESESRVGLLGFILCGFLITWQSNDKNRGDFQCKHIHRGEIIETVNVFK